jgi:hypothetical protein
MTRCIFCGRPAGHRHHLTARLEPDAPYLDEEWTVSLCGRCHSTEHAAWRHARIASIDDPLLARLARNTWFIGRLIDLGRPVTFSTEELRGLHGSLVACLDLATYGHNPGTLP